MLLLSVFCSEAVTRCDTVPEVIKAEWSDTTVHVACTNNNLGVDKQSNISRNKSVTKTLIASLTSRCNIRKRITHSQLNYCEHTVLLISLLPRCKSKHSTLTFYSTNQLHCEWMVYMLHVNLALLDLSQRRGLITVAASEEMRGLSEVLTSHAHLGSWSLEHLHKLEPAVHRLEWNNRDMPTLCWWINWISAVVEEVERFLTQAKEPTQIFWKYFTARGFLPSRSVLSKRWCNIWKTINSKSSLHFILYN